MSRKAIDFTPEIQEFQGACTNIHKKCNLAIAVLFDTSLLPFNSNIWISTEVEQAKTVIVL